MYYVYLLMDKRGKEYIGYTSDLRKRMRGHNSGGCSYTRGKRWELIYYEAYKYELDARRREVQLKRHGGVRQALYKRLGL